MSTNKTFVFFKDTLTDSVVEVDLIPLLVYGETLTMVEVGSVNPQTDLPLLITNTSGNAPLVVITLTGGQENISYGTQLIVTTSVRVFTCLLAISVNTNVQVPYTTSDPNAYVDLVDTIEAGKACIGTAIFSFPATLDPSGGFVNWEFLDASGTVYSSGNAFDYNIKSDGISNTVIAKSVINVPSSVPASQQNQKYQLRYTLDMTNQADPAANNNQQYIYYSSESVTVIGLNTVPLGAMPTVEMQGDPATVSLVTSQLYDNVILEVYKDNDLLGSSRITDFQRVSSGYYYAGVLQTSEFPVSLESYRVVWKYSNLSNPAQVFRESASLWIINSSIMNAVDDVKSKINKARTTLYGTPDLLFPIETILVWLRRGMDAFNGAYGTFTSFTFTNAKGPVREFWLLYAELFAIESQYMAEGEKAFDFQGAAISLTVDRTSYLDSAAGKIQSRLDAEVKSVKQNLIIKGNIGGPGDTNPTALQRGAIGSVGITITNASIWGAYGPAYGRRLF